MFKFLKQLLLFIVASFSLAIIAVVAVYLYIAPELPSLEEMKTIRVQTPLRVYTKEGELYAIFGDKRRIPIDLEDVPQQIIDAFIAAEDDRFYEHLGIDYEGLIRATINLIETGQRTQGGSTITMQLARNFFLSNQRTFERKIKEIYLALIIERLLSKAEILNLYLNKIFLGKRAYGIAAAAEIYYGKNIGELTLAQNAMIASLPKAPSTYNPIANPEKAKERRAYVLGRMLKLQMISADEYAQAMAAPITAAEHNIKMDLQAPYVAEMVRAYMVEQYGESAYSDGFDVYTTIHQTMQENAQASLRRGLLNYDRRHGWRGTTESIEVGTPVDHAALQAKLRQLPSPGGLLPAVVIEANRDLLRVIPKDAQETTLARTHWQWQPYLNSDYVGPAIEEATKIAQRGDIIWLLNQDNKLRVAQIPEIEGALVALDPNSGALLALTGGFDFYQSKFNRATQAKRQPGSSFKPFIYASALAEGYTPATIVNDTPVVFSETSSRQDWRPENYSGKFFGPTRLREALTYSRNMVSVKLVDAIGLRKTLDYIKKFGFARENHPYNLTMALGSGTATPLEITRGYATFANGGFLVTPYFIEKIISNEEVLFEAAPPKLCGDNCYPEIAQDDINSQIAEDNVDEQLLPQAIPADIAYQLSSMLQSVTRKGTARSVYRTLKRSDLAGKTGTTNNQHDAWFSGFNRNIACTVWVGFDNQQPLGNRETGAVAALPIWIDFIEKTITENDETPYFRPPEVVSAKIDPESGLLAHPSDTNAILETFRKDYLPKKIATPAGQKEKDIEKLF
ncbi:MAG: penicillin-binding protein 1A [Chromatiales bacterium]|nr:penicillin-binding protein 1A [Chromatiales bacterium]